MADLWEKHWDPGFQVNSKTNNAWTTGYIFRPAPGSPCLTVELDSDALMLDRATLCCETGMSRLAMAETHGPFTGPYVEMRPCDQLLVFTCACGHRVPYRPGYVWDVGNVWGSGYIELQTWLEDWAEEFLGLNTLESCLLAAQVNTVLRNLAEPLEYWPALDDKDAQNRAAGAVRATL